MVPEPASAVEIERLRIAHPRIAERLEYLEEKWGGPHRIEFSDDGWALQHPGTCRDESDLLDCRVHKAVSHYMSETDGPPVSPGVYGPHHVALPIGLKAALLASS